MRKNKMFIKLLSVILSIMIITQVIPMQIIASAVEKHNHQTEVDSYSTSVSQEEKEAVVLGEDTSLRNENNIKYFNMSDGTVKAAVYTEPVHYKNKSGKWEDIDNTLVKSGEDDSTDEIMNYNGFITKNNSFKVKFAKNANQKKLVSIKSEEYQMSFSLINDSKNKKSYLNQSHKSTSNDFLVADKVNQKVFFEDILSDTNIEYIVGGSDLKENIVVKNIQNDYKYSFEIDIKNLTLSLEESGEIVARDINTKNEIFILPKPFMFDSNYEFSDNVCYNLYLKNKNKYLLTISADEAWINENNRAFPVIIDPGIQTVQSSAAMDSVYVASAQPSTNRYSDPMIMVGRDSSNVGKCHGLIKFNLPTMNRGDVIVDSQFNALQIYADAYSSTTPDSAIEIHAATSSWNKNTVTWNTQPSFEATVADFEILKANQAGSGQITRTWNVTSIVKKWYEDPNFANNGFLLKSSTESASTLNNSCIYMWLYGEKYSQSTAGYPILSITYRSNKGLESYWSYTSLDVGRAGTASICDFSGNLVFTHNDVSTAGSRAPASIAHVFNNYMANEGFGAKMPYRGHGWMLSCQQQVLPSSRFNLSSSAQATYPYVYIDGDGTEHYFYKKSDGTMIDEDGMGLTLTLPKTNNNNYYKITDDNGNAMWFNIAGGFARSLDSNGNQIANYYTSAQVNELNRVTDGAGHQITMSATADNLAISSITDTAGRTTLFNWSSGKLTSITYPDSETTIFTYDNDGAMTSVTAPDGYKLQFAYTPLSKGKRVSTVTESVNGTLGQTITFDYSQYGKTVVRSSGKDGIYGNSDDIYTTTSFDSAGRTISSESTCNGKSLGATSAEYTASKANSTASNIKQLNRLSKSATGGTYVRNYLREGSADRSGYWTNAQWNGTADFSGAVSSTNQLYGRWSYRIISNSLSVNAGARTYQTLTSGQFAPGYIYTFSAWVKTSGVVSTSNKNYGAELMATYWNPDGTTKDFHSESIVGTTDTAINNGWQRLSVTFSVPSGATQIRCNIMLRESTGTAYFDGMQLEKGAVASNFNMLNNSSFEKYSLDSTTGAYWPEDWSGYLTGTGDSVDNAHARDSGHAFRYNSVPTVAKEMNQQIYLGGTTAQNLDDTYILSGWVYANPVGGNNENNKISLAAKVLYSDGTSYLNWFDYNASVIGWQYIMGAFTLRDGSNSSANKTPTSIKIYTINYRQSNNSWFDDIQLVRDEAPSYTYDSKGNLVSVKANAEQNSAMEYTNNNLTKYTDAKGFNYTYTYDSNHNMTQATSQGGTKYCYTYDSNGNPTALKIKSTETLYIDTGATYTSNGAFVSNTSDQDGHTESYVYNDSKGTLTSYTDKKGNVTNYSYDDNTDALTSVSQTLSNNQTIQNNYTYENDRLKTISHNGFNYSFNYDGFGNVTQTQVGSQVLCTNTYGSHNGNLNRVTYGNNAYVDYTYDDYGNISAISQNGTRNFEWNYDSTGNLYSHNDFVNNQKYLYTYDSTNRLIRQSVIDSDDNHNVYDAEYGYDLNNNANRFTSRAGGKSLTESFSYGSDNLVSSYTYPTGKTVTYTYDGLLRRNTANIDTTTPITHQYVYLLSDRGNNARTTKVGWEHFNDYIYAYTYDANGNITLITRRNKNIQNSTYENQQQFAYDELNQLIRADDLAKNCTEVYNYDNGGNILSVTTYPLTWGSLNGVTATQTINYAYGDTNWKDKLTSYSGTAITYDSIGNPLSYRGYTLTWQNGRQLATLNGNGKTVSYTYDVDGLRTSKTVNGVKHDYYYVGSNLQYEKYGTTELWFYYDSDGNPSGVRYKNGNTTSDYYFTCNWRGDVVKIYDATGSFVANYDYDAWGNVISVTNENGTVITSLTHIANVNPIRYRGYYYDSETGLYYVSSRYYNPETCRFINADDTDTLTATMDDVTDKNLFAYCDNNPIMRVDEDGEFWKLALASGGIGGSSGFSLATLGAKALATLGAITPAGWVAIGVTAVVTIGIISYSVYESSKSKSDPYGRPGQKKQGRERKEKKKNNNWKQNPNKKAKPLPKHTPGRDHRKYRKR